MKIILQFEDGEEALAEQCYRGPKYAIAAEGFDNFLRSKIKYDQVTPEQMEVYEKVREVFYVHFEGLLPY